MSTLWYNNPRVLVEKFEILYSKNATATDNANALARFIILLSLLTYLIFRRPVVALLVLCSLPVAVPVERDSVVPESESALRLKYCQSPTVDNPLGNANPGDFGNGMK